MKVYSIDPSKNVCFLNKSEKIQKMCQKFDKTGLIALLPPPSNGEHRISLPCSHQKIFMSLYLK